MIYHDKIDEMNQDISSNFEKEAVGPYLNNVAPLQDEAAGRGTEICTDKPLTFFCYLRISPFEKENWRKNTVKFIKRKSSSQQTDFFDSMVG